MLVANRTSLPNLPPKQFGCEGTTRTKTSVYPNFQKHHGLPAEPHRTPPNLATETAAGGEFRRGAGGVHFEEREMLPPRCARGHPVGLVSPAPQRTRSEPTCARRGVYAAGSPL